jgi:uncharacterized membrane protein
VTLLWLWCIALLAYRIHLTSNVESDVGAKMAFGLFWNLFLATLPLVWSAGLESAAAKNRSVTAAIFFGLWLLFLPNAPYILTDLIHLKPYPNVPLWFLLAILLSCAGTGTLFGYFSLNRVHNVVEQKFGKVAGWGVAVGSLMLCGYGIYLGRFLRWNSWDAITNPVPLLHDAVGKFFDSGIHPHPLEVTTIFGMGLILGYVAIGMMPALQPRE